MDAGLTDEQRMLRDTAARINERFGMAEALRRNDIDRLYPFDLCRAWVEAGFFGLAFPVEHGGLGGSVLDLVLLAEEVARPSNDLSMCFGGIEIAQNIAPNAVIPNNMVIQALPRIADMSAQDGLWTESIAQAVSLTSDEARQGMDAFLTRRMTDF